MSRRSSSACKLSEVQALETVETCTVKPKLFGLQLTMSCCITEIPQWFLYRTGYDAEPALVSSPSGGDTAAKLSPVKVGMVLIIGAFVTLWLAQLMAEDLSSSVTVSLLLLWVFGGHEKLEAIGISPEAIGIPLDDAQPVVERRTELVTVAEAIELPEMTLELVELYTPRIRAWLTDSISNFTTELNFVLVNSSADAPSSTEIIEGLVQPSPSVVDGTETNETTTEEPSVEEKAEAVLTLMNELPNVSTDINLDIDKPDSRLAVILLEQEHPTFRTSGDFHVANDASRVEPVYDSGSECGTALMSWSNRLVAADMMDLYYMYGELKQHLPLQVHEYIASMQLNYWYRTRDQGGFNHLVRDLELEWFRLVHHQPLPMNIERVKFIVGQFRKQAYLDAEEDFFINEGIADYSMDYRAQKVVGEVQQTLRTNEQFRKVDYSSKPILQWLDNVQDKQLVDPYVYGRCKCAEAAMRVIRWSRRDEEGRYKPKTQRSFKKFPLRQMPEHQSDDRYLCDVEPRTAYPRSQQITQLCKQHKTITNNLFVLVDTSVEDANNRLSNSGGMLPAPGRRHSSICPDGW
ncbi:hypothetical protein G6011_11790 [Alternaria panax]|uniref:Uncharacterized protein n=1 Tax=Alternaria panax TaxID=48097 RepID=A0AAD4F7V7_9PLEO|nr:hypothetical protein G6011_11790 [Alternaria panax]